MRLFYGAASPFARIVRVGRSVNTVALCLGLVRNSQPFRSSAMVAASRPHYHLDGGLTLYLAQTQHSCHQMQSSGQAI